jgi:riboflavin kinase/FMN adenylyltransferase
MDKVMKIIKEIQGIVVKGTLIGKKIGFPTINIAYDTLDLPFGVYVCKVHTQDGEFSGAMHYGPKETLGIHEPSLEVHLLDFSGDIYGQSVRIEVYEKIRDVRGFETLEALKKQLRLDVDHVRAVMLQ